MQMLVAPPLAQYLWEVCAHKSAAPQGRLALPCCCRAAAVLLRRYGRGAAVRVQCCVLRHMAHARRRQTARRSVMPQRELTTRPAYAGRGLTRQTYRTLALTLTLIRHGLTRRT